MSSEYSSDSDDVNIRAIKRQKTLVIDSDMESGHETHWCWGMHFPLPLLKSSLKTVSRRLEDFTGVSGVHILNAITCKVLMK